MNSNKSNTKSAPATKRKVKSKRMKRNFSLAFPRKFTISQLERANPKVPYITLYVRVKNGLKNKTIKKIGLQEPEKTRQGRRELLFAFAKRILKKRKAVKKVATPVAPAVIAPVVTPVAAGVTVNAVGDPIAVAV